MLGFTKSADFEWTPGPGGSGMTIKFPRISFRDLPSTWAWVLKLENLAANKKPYSSPALDSGILSRL
jgi:Alpha-L-fucosidase C-terminal domain